MFEHFDHPADMGIRGFGSDWKEAYSEAAKAMFAIIGHLDHFVPETEIEFTCHAYNKEELLVDFLNQLLYQASVQKCFFSDFTIEEWSEVSLKVKARGEKIKQNHKNSLKTEVKGATYSELLVHQTDKHFIAQCIVDL